MDEHHLRHLRVAHGDLDPLPLIIGLEAFQLKKSPRASVGNRKRYLCLLPKPESKCTWKGYLLRLE